jgi:hypothetical protein
MAELEAALAEFNAAVVRGDASHEDLEADFDLQDGATSDDSDGVDEVSMVDQGNDGCSFTCSATMMGSSGWYTVPKRGYKPKPNGWYVNRSPFSLQHCMRFFQI